MAFKLFKSRSELDLTTGNLFWKIPLFVIPLMCTTIFQLLYTTIDLWTVSQFGGGSLSMSAIGSNSALINLIITMLVSLATGANVCISAAKGAGDQERAKRILHTSFIVAVVGGIAVGIIGYFLAPYLLKLMDTPDSILEKASTYLKVYFIGVPLLMIYNFGSQMLRALGDSRRPLYILIISGILNVIFDFVFVCSFKMDVLGVAIATVISEAVSAILTILWFVFSKSTFVNLRWNDLRVDSRSLKDILRIGLPAGIQGVAFCLPNVLIQSSLYTIDNYYINGTLISQNEIVAGSSAAAQIEGYCFAVIDAFAVGIISFVGQNYGARNIGNIKKVYWYTQAWMMISWSIIALVCGLAPRPLLSIFVTESADVVAFNAIEAGKQRLYIMIFTYWLDGIMDINGNYLRGMKISAPPAIITLIGCTGTRILFLYTLFQLPTFHTIFWLYAAFPISWILVNIVYIPVCILYFNQVKKRLTKKEEIVKPELVENTDE